MINSSDLWLVRIATVLTAGTGLVYAAMRYLLKPSDEWPIVNHPWQPHVQHAHILVAPLLIFAVAVVWRSHALSKLARISHQLPAAAEDTPCPATFSPIGMLDGLSSTTPRPSGRKRHWTRRLLALATKPGEICRLEARGKTGRFSGWGLIVVFWPMAASGFLVQVSVSETWRNFWSLTHLICALIWLAAATGHIIASIRKRRRQHVAVTRIPIIPSTSFKPLQKRKP